jgi:hypothetical protein
MSALTAKPGKVGIGSRLRKSRLLDNDPDRTRRATLQRENGAEIHAAARCGVWLKHA